MAAIPFLVLSFAGCNKDDGTGAQQTDPSIIMKALINGVQFTGKKVDVESVVQPMAFWIILAENPARQTSLAFGLANAVTGVGSYDMSNNANGTYLQIGAYHYTLDTNKPHTVIFTDYNDNLITGIFQAVFIRSGTTDTARITNGTFSLDLTFVNGFSLSCSINDSNFTATTVAESFPRLRLSCYARDSQFPGNKRVFIDCGISSLIGQFLGASSFGTRKATGTLSFHFVTSNSDTSYYATSGSVTVFRIDTVTVQDTVGGAFRKYWTVGLKPFSLKFMAGFWDEGTTPNTGNRWNPWASNQLIY